MNISILRNLGFSDKSSTVYLELLRLGPSSVRALAGSSGLNRGTTYDILSWLKDKGLVTFYKKDSKQLFVAENPTVLQELVRKESMLLKEAERDLERVIPELQALHHRGGDRPVARYYGKKEIKNILEDVLSTCEAESEKMYRIYSAEGLREYLYEEFPSFSDARVSKGISVRVIALGKGGEMRGLDERKWLSKESKTATYILIYPGKTAYISLDAKNEPVGVVIENPGVYETQKIIFDELWAKL